MFADILFAGVTFRRCMKVDLIVSKSKPRFWVGLLFVVYSRLLEQY